MAPKAPAAAPARVAAKPAKPAIPAAPARRAPSPRPAAARGNGQAHGALAVAMPETDWKEF
jgi:hypothetical protein